jgi:hypothetical protein
LAFLKAAIWTVNVRREEAAGGAVTAGGAGFVSFATPEVAGGGVGFVSFVFVSFVMGALGRLTGGARGLGGHGGDHRFRRRLALGLGRRADVVPAEPLRDREDQHEGDGGGRDPDPHAAERRVRRLFHLVVGFVLEPRGLLEAGEFHLRVALARAQALERQLALIVLVVFPSRLVIGQHSLGLAWPPPPSGKNKNRLG